MPPPVTDRCRGGVMFSGCVFVSLGVLPKKLIFDWVFCGRRAEAFTSICGWSSSFTCNHNTVFLVWSGMIRSPVLADSKVVISAFSHHIFDGNICQLCIQQHPFHNHCICPVRPLASFLLHTGSLFWVIHKELGSIRLEKTPLYPSLPVSLKSGLLV